MEVLRTKKVIVYRIHTGGPTGARGSWPARVAAGLLATLALIASVLLGAVIVVVVLGVVLLSALFVWFRLWRLKRAATSAYAGTTTPRPPDAGQPVIDVEFEEIRRERE